MKHFRSLFIYGFSIFFNAGVSFAAFSLLTHHLNEVDYGIINLYSSFSIFLMPFIGIGIQFTLSVDYFKMDRAAFRARFTNAIGLSLIACFCFTLLSLIFHSFIRDFLNVNFFFAVIIPFICLLTVLNDVFLNLARSKEKHILYAGFTIFKNLAEVGLIILLVVGLNFRWEGRLSSNLIVLIISGAVIVFFIRAWHLYSGRLDKQAIGRIVVLGLPFIPERLAIFVLFYSDRFFIDYYRGTGDVGFYSAGAQIAIIVNLMTLTLINTFQPYLLKKLSEAVVDYSLVKKAILTFIGISALISTMVIGMVPFIFKYFVGSAFQSGQKYALNLIIGLFFWAIYNVFLALLLFKRKNNLIMFISIFGMVTSLIANFINVKKFGAFGATYTNIITYSLMAGLTIYFVHRLYGLKKIFVSQPLLLSK